MEPVTLLLTFAGVQALATLSPGPAFLVVTRSALEGGTRAGLSAAMGCTLGFLVWIAATLAGLEVIIQKASALYDILKVAGALFLIYLAIEQWRHATDPLPPQSVDLASSRTRLDYFTRSVLLQLANPKALAYCMSVVIVLVPAETPMWLKVAVVGLATAIEGTWWTVLSLLASRTAFRARYEKMKAGIDRIVGVLLGGLGLRLLADRL